VKPKESVGQNETRQESRQSAEQDQPNHSNHLICSSSSAKWLGENLPAAQEKDLADYLQDHFSDD